MKIIHNYFPDLNNHQIKKFNELLPIYSELNSKVNLISRKDMGNFYTHHVLHSLSIAKFKDFIPGTRVLDLGTGGGFPGIPLAIFFPKVNFYLIDGVGKKIDSVKRIIKKLDLKNVVAKKVRAEDFDEIVDFVTVRAVSKVKIFLPWIKKNFSPNDLRSIERGLICLKGGNLFDEISEFSNMDLVNLNKYFDEEFFETKKLIYIPAKSFINESS